MKTIRLVRNLAKAGHVRRGLEVDAAVKNGKTKVELEIEYFFELDTINKDKVIKQLATKLGVKESYLSKITNFVEK